MLLRLPLTVYTYNMVHFYRGIIFTCILKQFICIVEARIDIRIVCNDVLLVLNLSFLYVPQTKVLRMQSDSMSGIFLSIKWLELVSQTTLKHNQCTSQNLQNWSEPVTFLLVSNIFLQCKKFSSSKQYRMLYPHILLCQSRHDKS